MKLSHFSIIIMSLFVISLTSSTGVFAQNDSTLKYDPTLQYGSKLQTPTETPEQLHKKLVNARDAISNIMGSKIGDIPFNEVSVDEVNSTLDVGIDSSKATLSEEQYLQKIKEIVGDIPIRITFGQISSLPLILTNNPVPSNDSSSSNDVMKSSGPVVITLESPLKQFKSGTLPVDVQCNDGFLLTFKAYDGSPACVKPDTKIQLLKIGWAVPGPKDFGYNPGRGPLAFQDTQSDGVNYHGLPRVNGVTIFYNGTTLSDNVTFDVKQGQNMTLMLDVISNSVNTPVTLYTAPHSGFTKTNGIDFKLSDTSVHTPATVMLSISVSKDATPSTYGATVKANETRLGSVTYLFFVTVK